MCDPLPHFVYLQVVLIAAISSAKTALSINQIRIVINRMNDHVFSYVLGEYPINVL